MTCNKKTDKKIDDNFFDRCSRVRYFKEYEANSKFCIRTLYGRR